MSKWYGKVGYAIPEEIEPGVYAPIGIDERLYYGDAMSNRWNKQATDSTNDNINLTTTISIVADPFAYQHCSNIVFVEYLGTRWKVTSIDPQRPRILLTIGGVYNG